MAEGPSVRGPQSESGAQLPRLPPSSSPLHQPVLHESGHLHVTGQARYIDDFPAPRGLLVCDFVVSPHAHARLTGFDDAQAKKVPGVVAVLSARDVAGHNHFGAVVHDEVLFAEGEVHYRGQVVALVVGETYDACRAGVKAVQVAYEPLPAATSLEQGLAAGTFLTDPVTLTRGDAAQALAQAEVVVEGEVRTGAQDHFYLETHVALATPGEDGTLHVASSTQHPAEVQAIVAELTGRSRHQVVVEAPRMGGGFGGKETQAAPFAAMAALAALQHRAPGEGLARSRSRHGDHRQAAPLPDPLPRRLHRAGPVGGAGGRPLLRRRLGQRPVARHPRAGALPHRQRLLRAPRAGDRPGGAHQPAQQHRLPRLRRAPGHGGDGDGARARGRAAAAGRGPGAPAELLRRGHRHADAVLAGAQRQPPAAPVGRAAGVVVVRGAARRGGCLQRPLAVEQARAGHHAGEVRHQLHHQLPQPGRRAGAHLWRRHRAGEPRRHRDGAGAAHQDAGPVRA